MLTAAAISEMSREDAKAEATAKRNGWMQPDESYGFVCISRNVRTGAVQHSPLYRTRAEALQAVMGPKRGDWMHESIERTRTIFNQREAA